MLNRKNGGTGRGRQRRAAWPVAHADPSCVLVHRQGDLYSPGVSLRGPTGPSPVLRCPVPAPRRQTVWPTARYRRVRCQRRHSARGNLAGSICWNGHRQKRRDCVAPLAMTVHTSAVPRLPRAAVYVSGPGNDPDYPHTHGLPPFGRPGPWHPRVAGDIAQGVRGADSHCRLCHGQARHRRAARARWSTPSCSGVSHAPGASSPPVE